MGAGTVGPAGPSAILLTGRPGIGKSTVIQRTLERLDTDAGGFLTLERREQGRRTGFRLVTLDGETALLATTRRTEPLGRAQPFGRYRVALDVMDQVAVPALRAAQAAGLLVVVDEIGPMELLSDRFRGVIEELLARQSRVFGTIMSRSHPFADRVKAHPAVVVREVTRENRDVLPQVLARLL